MDTPKPSVRIIYCRKCRWLLRSAWMMQELLTTFEDELGEVTLQPGEGGIFEIYAGETLIWSRAEQQSFPEMKQLKQLVRDQIAPDRDLGHSDKSNP